MFFLYQLKQRRKLFRLALVAQWIERLTSDQMVVGSTPAEGTSLIEPIRFGAVNRLPGTNSAAIEFVPGSLFCCGDRHTVRLVIPGDRKSLRNVSDTSAGMRMT